MTPRSLPLDTLVDLVAGAVSGDVGDAEFDGVATLDAAGPQDISFVAAPRYLRYLADTRAGAVLVPQDIAIEDADRGASVVVRVRDTHLALAQVITELYPAAEPDPGVHPSAVVGEEVGLGEGVQVGPCVVLGRGVVIGAGTVLGAGTVIGDGCHLGEGCRLHPGVTLYSGVRLGDRCILHSGVRVGCDGFGYAFADGEHRKIPHVGGCRIEDDVEIGANSTVDRGSIGDTVIGPGTKIDNLVHIGHNVRMGARCIVVAQVGISGSTRVGDGVVIGGQAGIGGHLILGDGARIGAQAGVTADVPAGETVSGYPARPHREALRAQAALFRLPALMERVREIERQRPGGDD